MDVFMVENPHQLLNAVEARHTTAARDPHLIIVPSKDAPQVTFAPLVRIDDWESVQYVPLGIDEMAGLKRRLKFHRSSRIRGYFHHYERRGLRKRVDGVARNLGPARNLFLGNYWIAHMRHFANVLPHDQLFVLDDGTQTLQINDRRKKGLSFDKSKHSKAVLSNIIDRLIGLRTEQAERLLFFTTYDLDTRKEDGVVNHDYSFLRSQVGVMPRSEEVFFLGSELRNEGLSVDRYVEYFQGVQRYFEHDTLVYVQHPRESPQQVERIGRVLRGKMVRFDTPIEYELTFGQRRPRVVASFCSSALETCRVIFGDSLSVKSFYIAPEDCTANPSLIRDIYAYYESKTEPGFEVIRLGDGWFLD